ncbi:MAG: hypothetical protein JWO03_1756 [Bacteroidetes bacterium]|nr:hypothetical protein [Bacteroidota bacterium]
MRTSPIFKRTIALFAGSLLLAQLSSAQFVTIPDSTFVTWLHGSNYASCMNGNQMDTTCTALVTDTLFDIRYSQIHDITGVQYLRNVTYLYCDEARLTYIPAFPPALRELHCYFNRLTALPPLPATLTTLDCSSNKLTSLPAFPAGLSYIDCSYNHPMATFTSLPPSLTHLDMHQDQMPGTMPSLPLGLTFLNVSGNSFYSLPALPASLLTLLCLYDSLTVLPALPAGLIELQCDGNQITALPTIPFGLQDLSANENLLTTTPFLPNSLTSVAVVRNRLTSIPNLPDSMMVLYCSFNPDLTCLPRLGKIGSLNFDNTAITCLGNYPIPDSIMGSIRNPPLSTIPICTAVNANGCNVFTGVRDVNTLSTLSIYPNPVNDLLNISGSTTTSLQIAICNLQGQSLRTITTDSHTTEIQISGLAPGMYVLRLSADGDVENRTFVKE